MHLGATISGAFGLFIAAAAQGVDISGAGASFADPLYERWVGEYRVATGHVVSYRPTGSATALKEMRARTLDFCAVDTPLEPADLRKAGLIQFPVVAMGVVPIVSLRGVNAGQLKLTGPVMAEIFFGRIGKWNDRTITELNPDIALPDLPITVVHRSDATGATRLWTDYLSRVSPEWARKVGAGTAIHWPKGVGGYGNGGVASYVQRITGAIGYVDHAYAWKHKLKHVSLRNTEGHFVQPDHTTIQRAAAVAESKDGAAFGPLGTNTTGSDGWPIAGTGFVLIDARAENPAATLAAMQFFDWALKRGHYLALELGFTPLPETVVERVNDAWRARVRDAGGNAVWR